MQLILGLKFWERFFSWGGIWLGWKETEANMFVEFWPGFGHVEVCCTL